MRINLHFLLQFEFVVIITIISSSLVLLSLSIFLWQKPVYVLYNRSHEKSLRKFLHPITIAKRLTFSHAGKAFYPIRNQLSKWISQFATCSSCAWLLFNLYLQKFVKFPQVYTTLIFSQTTYKPHTMLWPNLRAGLSL